MGVKEIILRHPEETVQRFTPRCVMMNALPPCTGLTGQPSESFGTRSVSAQDESDDAGLAHGPSQCYENAPAYLADGACEQVVLNAYFAA